MRLGRGAAITLTLLIAATVAGAGVQNDFQEISWSPVKVTSGSPCLFRVRITGSPAHVSGTWQGRELVFIPSAQGDAWYALGGVDVETKPGSYKLDVQATLADGAVVHQERSVLVGSAHFPTERLRVAQRYVEPDPDTLVRIQSDQQLKHAAFSHEAGAEWSGSFRAPVDTTVSEGFGTRRTFNGKLASIHRGLDYHARPGTVVMAANSGEVVLARELFYEGNCVIIDHGQQFTTIYMHLSKLEVSEGQKVGKGQEIGLSGGTGRATGPHLHLAVRWQGAYLDPAQLLALTLPELHTALAVQETRAGSKNSDVKEIRSGVATEPASQPAVAHPGQRAR